MALLTITYDGTTVYNREVESFGLEANARGDLFVTASTEPSEPEQGEASLIDAPGVLYGGDDRYTAAELALIKQRETVEKLESYTTTTATFDNG